MRLWSGRLVLVLLWILATHGALDLVERIDARSGVLGIGAFLVVTVGLVWVGAHLGDEPLWGDDREVA